MNRTKPMAIDHTKQHGTPEEPITGDPKTEGFDANRFGKLRMPTDFFRWAISTPLPKAREEDLWHDTIPPGPIKVEARPREPLPEEPTVQLKSDGRITQPKVLHLSPDEAQALRLGSGHRTKRKIAIIIALASAIGALIAWIVLQEGSMPPQGEPSSSALAEHNSQPENPEPTQIPEALVPSPDISQEATPLSDPPAKVSSPPPSKPTRTNKSPAEPEPQKPFKGDPHSLYNDSPIKPAAKPKPHPAPRVSEEPVAPKPEPTPSNVTQSPFQPK